MLLVLLAYLAGALTIVSPCILPVLPFVLARADRPFLRNGLPLLAGMAATFAAVASLAAVAGGWAVAANQWGRAAAMILLAFFGLTLLFPALASRVFQPLAGLGAKLSGAADRGDAAGGGGVGASLLLGVATGLLWAPCAGPVLGLVLTGAALGGASAGTTALLFAYALGAATSLALALLAGRGVLAAMKRSLGASEWIRRGLGAAVLAGVAAIALGLDTGFLTRVSSTGTAALEQRLLDALQPGGAQPTEQSGAAMAGGPAMGAADGAMAPAMSGGAPAMSGGPSMSAGGAAMSGGAAMAADEAGALPVEGLAPSLDGAVEWLNSPPLTLGELEGKVVLVDFWTYSCINCVRAIPYVRAWAEKYRGQGLVVIGVHAPEFAFEKRIDNVKRAVKDLGIGYPVAIDNDYAIWRAFANNYWPAHYFIDAEGRIRHHHFGEGDYEGSERVIQALLAEAGARTTDDLVTVDASGAQAASDEDEVLSPETYLGYARAEHFVSPGGAAKDEPHVYEDGAPRRNEWGLAGDWTVGAEHAAANGPGGRIVFRFHARDLHLVLGPGPDGAPVRFRVTLDGEPPGADHGVDVDEAGNGVVDGQRLYQLVRQAGPVRDRTFEIELLDPGVEAYAFTFG